MTRLSHMLTMDTGEVKRTRRTPGGHPTARDRGSPRLGFPQKRPNASEKQLCSGAGPQPPRPTPGQLELPAGAGAGRILWGRGPEFLPLPMGTALCCWKSKLLASTWALATPVGPRRQCLAAFKANQFHDETQGRNKTTAENTCM